MVSQHPGHGEQPRRAILSLEEMPPEQQEMFQFWGTLHVLTPRVFVTQTIVALNVLVFIAMVVSGAHFLNPDHASLIKWGANYGPLTTSGEWWRLLTCCFVHIGIIHIALNMYVLWDAGKLVEKLVGNVGFILLYLISGLAGSLVSLQWQPFGTSAGASGAIFGVFGALLGIVLRSRKSIPYRILAGLQRSLVVLIGYNLIFGLAANKSGLVNIDMAAHLGGLVAGAFCGLILGQHVDLRAAEQRWKHNIVLAGVGVLGVGLGIQFAPHDLPDIELARHTVNKLIGEFNSAVKGKITDAQLADTVEEKILPPWNAMLEKMEKAKHVGNKEPFITKLILYMQLRKEGWELLVQGIRINDRAARNRAEQKAHEANQVMDNKAQRGN